MVWNYSTSSLPARQIVQKCLELRGANSALTKRQIATKVGVSLYYLDRAFKEAGETLSRPYMDFRDRRVQGTYIKVARRLGEARELRKDTKHRSLLFECVCENCKTVFEAQQNNIISGKVRCPNRCEKVTGLKPERRGGQGVQVVCISEPKKGEILPSIKALGQYYQISKTTAIYYVKHGKPFPDGSIWQKHETERRSQKTSL